MKEEKNIKIPQEISQAMRKKVFVELIKAVAIMAYFLMLIIAYGKMRQERLIGDIKVFSGAFLLIGILLLEVAYRNDKGKTAISAIETIVLSIHTLSIMHVITILKYDLKTYLVISSFGFAIYYILKAVIIYIKDKKEYLDSLNDISEIVRKDEPIKKEAKKRKKKNYKKKKRTSR